MGYVRETAFETVFDGQTVNARLKPLTIKDAIDMNRRLPEAGDSDVVIDQKAVELLELWQVRLPSYVVELRNVRAADGTEVKMEEVFQNVYFIRLVKAIGMALLKAASPADPQQPSGRSDGGSEGGSPSKVTPLSSVA